MGVTCEGNLLDLLKFSTTGPTNPDALLVKPQKPAERSRALAEASHGPPLGQEIRVPGPYS